MDNSEKRRLSWYELLFWIPMGLVMWSFQRWHIFSDLQRMTKVESSCFMVRVLVLIAPLSTVSVILMTLALRQGNPFVFLIEGIAYVWLVSVLLSRYGLRLEAVTQNYDSYVVRVSAMELLMGMVVTGTAGYAILCVIATPANDWGFWLPVGLFAEFIATFGMWRYLPLVHPQAR